MDGSKLIVLATFIGLVCFVFTTLPFIAFVAAGVMEDKNRNNDKSVTEILLKALGWHLVSVIVLIFIINVLNIVTSNIEDNLIKGKCMQEIFWQADSKTTVFNNAKIDDTTNDNLGLGQNTYQKDGAYSFLKTVYTLVKHFYAYLPLIVFFLSAYIGWKLAAKKQDSNFLNTLVSMAGYIILGLFVYTVWTFTADIGMFMPSGETLFELKNDYWQEALDSSSSGINVTL